MNWLAWRHRLEYLIFRTLVCVIGMLSPARARDCAEGLVFVVHRVLPRKLTRYAVAHDNLRQALGPGPSEATIDDYIRRMRCIFSELSSRSFSFHVRLATTAFWMSCNTAPAGRRAGPRLTPADRC